MVFFEFRRKREVYEGSLIPHELPVRGELRLGELLQVGQFRPNEELRSCVGIFHVASQQR